MTGDGFDLTYNDTAASWEEKAVILKNAEWTKQGFRTSWEGGYISLVDGKGSGQIRRITKIDGNRVEFDRPLDIQPDEDTFVFVASFRRRFLFVNNVMNDSVIGLQFYGSMIETTVADNVFARNGGVHGAAMRGEPN